MDTLLSAFISRFESFTPGEAGAIARLLQVRSFRKGEILLKQGEITREC